MMQAATKNNKTKVCVPQWEKHANKLKDLGYQQKEITKRRTNWKGSQH